MVSEFTNSGGYTDFSSVFTNSNLNFLRGSIITQSSGSVDGEIYFLYGGIYTNQAVQGDNSESRSSSVYFSVANSVLFNEFFP